MIEKICIITPGILASNPRVVKEAESLAEAGYQVHIIYTRHVLYLIKPDEEILRKHSEWTYEFLDWTSPTFRAKVLKIFTGIRQKVVTLAFRYGLYSEKYAGILLNRFYHLQLKSASAQKADLYIAHYPDSIAVAAKAAAINKTMFAYDAEDYHRGESLPAWISNAIAITEDYHLIHACYISAASPMIAEAYKKHYPERKVFPFENMFPLKKQAPFKELAYDQYKFFWFSQTIGQKRGLEEFILILSLCKGLAFQLTLLGDVTREYKMKLQVLWSDYNLHKEDLIFISPVEEDEIFRIASEQHFGLCLEIPGVLNKELCLSNKLYSYILAGNYLILSKTKAQYNFHRSYTESGLKIDLFKPEEAASLLLDLIQNEDLNAKRKANFQLAQGRLNFDLEKELLINQIKSYR